MSVFLLYTSAVGAGPVFKAYKQATKGSPYEALRILKPYIPEPKEKPLYYFTLGLAYKRIGNTQKAIDFLRRAYVTAKDRSLKERALFLRGQVYEDAGFFYEARAAYGAFLRLFPKSSLREKVKIAYARTCLSIGDLAEAMKTFRTAPEDQIDVIVGKAEIFHKTGFYETAQELYQKAIEKDWQYFRDHPERLYWLAENIRKLGQRQRARRLYYFLLDSPMRQWAFLSLALIDMTEGKAHEAVLHLRMALQEPPNRARVNPWQRRELLRKVYLGLGRAYRMEKRPIKAKRMLLLLRREFPGTPEAEEGLVLLGAIYTGEDKFVEATGYLKEVLYGRTHKKEAVSQLKETILKAMNKDREVFLKIWKMAGAFLFDEAYSKDLLAIGDALKEAEDMDALKVYRFVLDRAQNDAQAEALKRLASLFIETRSAAGLRFVLSYMNRIKVDRDTYYRALAWLRALEGEKAKAYRIFKKISRYQKYDLELLGLLSDGVKRYREFVTLYRKVSFEVKGPPDYGMLALFALKNNRPSEAIKYFKLFSKAIPDARLPKVMSLLLSMNMKEADELTGGTDTWAFLAETLKKESEIMHRLRRL